MKRIYLDYAATTPMHKDVLEAMQPYFTDKFGNPSSIHSFGREAKSAIDKSRDLIANFIGAKSDEILFTSGGTESDNQAIKEVVFTNSQRGNHIITTTIEHHAVLETCHLLKNLGYKITYVPVDKFGLVNPDEIKSAITDKTILISVMHANNEIGSLEPITEIGKIAKERGILFHTDAVQTFGAIPINVDELNIDMLSASAHKLYGPKGIGILYVRKGTRIGSLLHGGSQERRKRAGTENVAGIVGFGKAVEIAKIDMEKDDLKLKILNDRLKNGISSRIDDIFYNGHPEKRLPKNISVCIKYIEGESMLLNLDMKGIAASTGSACSSGSLEPSHVMLAIGLPHELAHGSLRFTMGKYTTEQDIDYVLEILPPIVEKLRSMSPLYKKE